MTIHIFIDILYGIGIVLSYNISITLGVIMTLIQRIRNSVGPCRKIDLAIERFLNTSSIHDDHLDRYPESAKQYTSSFDLVRALLPDGVYVLAATGPNRAQITLSVNGGLGDDKASWVADAQAPTLELAMCLAFIEFKGLNG